MSPAAVFALHLARADAQLFRGLVALEALLLWLRLASFLHADRQLGAMVSMLKRVGRGCLHAGWSQAPAVWHVQLQLAPSSSAPCRGAAAGIAPGAAAGVAAVAAVKRLQEEMRGSKQGMIEAPSSQAHIVLRALAGGVVGAAAGCVVASMRAHMLRARYPCRARAVRSSPLVDFKPGSIGRAVALPACTCRAAAGHLAGGRLAR